MWFVGKIFFDLLCRFWRGWSSAAPWWTATHRWGTETHTTSLGLELGAGGQSSEFKTHDSNTFIQLDRHQRDSHHWASSLNKVLPLSPSGGRPLPVPEGGGLHDGVQSSSGTEQVGRSSRNTTLTVLHFIFFFSTSVSGCSSVTTPWTRSTTTSGTSPSWSISHVSLRCPVCKREEKSRGWRSTFSVVYDLLMPHKITKQEWERKWT